MGGNNQLNKLPNLVAPRVTHFQGRDRVPISDAIEAMLCPSHREMACEVPGNRQVVYLDGADSQTVLEFLKDLFGNDARIKIVSTFLWNDWEDLDEVCHLLIHNDKEAVSTHLFPIAPWDRDDLIQFMLATRPTHCGSILGRIPSETFGLVRGGVSLWNGIVETMFSSPAENDFHRILVLMLRSRLPAAAPTVGHDTMKWLGDQLLSAYSQASKSQMGDAIDKLAMLSDDPVYQSLLSISTLRLRIASERFAERLRQSNKSILQAGHKSKLIIDVSKRLQGDLLVADFLKKCVYGKYASTAVSILSQIDPTWKPTKGKDYKFQNAYLSGASWAGSYLEGAKFGGATLTNMCLDESVLNDSILHFAQCDGVSMEDSCLRAVKANNASFVDSNFCRAEMRATSWQDCNFSRADFGNALLDESAFVRCDLRDTNFRSAVANRAQFCECNLRGSEFSDAELGSALFQGLDLRGTVWCRTNLNKTNLERAILDSLSMDQCNLYEANLFEANLSGTRMKETSLLRANLANTKLGDIDWENCDLREANLTGATFHYGSTRAGIVGSPYPSHGTRTGFYTDDREELHFKEPELVRKASLVGCDLRGARFHGVDFYLVDLRGAILDTMQRSLLASAGAILD